jgi:arabinogalactan oligomer/maltooligosaccharide transport system substrate-binding protein
VLFSAVVGFCLAGCGGGGGQRPVVLFLAISTLDDEAISRETVEVFHNRFREVVRGFQRLHPTVRVQLEVYKEQRLPPMIQRRQRSGLGPDLIVATADLANALLSRGIVEPMPLGAPERQALDSALLHRVRDRHGRFSGQPLALFTQQACFDTRRLRQAPATVQELLSASAAGIRVGLPLRLRDLFWSAGSLGALPALRIASEGGWPDPGSMRGLRAWMVWLQSAEGQSRLSFVDEEASLADGLRAGRLDWISCRSTDLQSLQRHLGPHFGIAPLPDGVGFQASPVNQLRVMALGRGSSPAQRQLAIALARYSLSPQVQRSFTLDNLSFLPVNRYVSVPVGYSRLLATMERARRQAMGAQPVLAALQHRDPRILRGQDLILQAVFGQVSPEQAAERIVAILRSRR